MKAMRLPWIGRDVPHAVLDINRDCNIYCMGCYNQRRQTAKSLEQIRSELKLLLSRRSLHTITILGGEPTLHPQLSRVIALAKARVKRVALVTNGLLLDEPAARRWRSAGLDLVLIHIDAMQSRPDLPPTPRQDDLDRLRREKVSIASKAGLTVGLQSIAYKGRLDDVAHLVRFVTHSPLISHLLVTNYAAVERISSVTGCIDSRMTACIDEGAPGGAEEVKNSDIADLMGRLGYFPTAFVGSAIHPSQARWLSYQIGCVRDRHGQDRTLGLRSSLFERATARLIRRVTGRYIFLLKPGIGGFQFQLLFNGLLGGRLMGNMRLLISSLKQGHDLSSKHMVFQQGPEVLQNGRVDHCRGCPDATLRYGKLVPLCLSDRMVT